MEKNINTEAEVNEAEVTEEETLKVIEKAESVITLAVGVALISDVTQDIRLLFISGGCMIIAGIIVLLHSKKK